MEAMVRGSLPEIIRNDHSLYEGDLKWYFRKIFHNAQNLWHPYHNFRHMTHVLWLCYQACSYYKEMLSPSQMRMLLIAAMFHDFDHSGLSGNDDLNIERAVRGFSKYIAPEDKSLEENISLLIRTTEFPHKGDPASTSLLARILRDADMCQVLNPVWIQQVAFGLAAEWGKTPIEILNAQEAFLTDLKFNTEWAKGMFPREVIEAKIKEVAGLLDILNPENR